MSVGLQQKVSESFKSTSMISCHTLSLLTTPYIIQPRKQLNTVIWVVFQIRKTPKSNYTIIHTVRQCIYWLCHDAQCCTHVREIDCTHVFHCCTYCLLLVIRTCRVLDVFSWNAIKGILFGELCNYNVRDTNLNWENTVLQQPCGNTRVGYIL